MYGLEVLGDAYDDEDLISHEAYQDARVMLRDELAVLYAPPKLTMAAVRAFFVSRRETAARLRNCPDGRAFSLDSSLHKKKDGGLKKPAPSSEWKRRNYWKTWWKHHGKENTHLENERDDDPSNDSDVPFDKTIETRRDSFSQELLEERHDADRVRMYVLEAQDARLPHHFDETPP